MLSDVQKSIAFWEVPRSSPACPSDKSIINMKMGMYRW